MTPEMQKFRDNICNSAQQQEWDTQPVAFCYDREQTLHWCGIPDAEHTFAIAGQIFSAMADELEPVCFALYSEGWGYAFENKDGQVGDPIPGQERVECRIIQVWDSATASLSILPRGDLEVWKHTEEDIDAMPESNSADLVKMSRYLLKKEDT